MTVKVNQDSYNKRLDDRIQELQTKCSNNITPANVSRIINTKIDYAHTQFYWDPNATLNGVQVSNVKEMIDYLKLNKVELSHLSHEYIITYI